MPKTMVRVYDVDPEDVHVRPNPHVPDEVIVSVGEVVSIQGPANKVRLVLLAALDGLVRDGVPSPKFDALMNEWVVDEPIDGTGF